MSTLLTIVIPPQATGTRLDRALTDLAPDLSRSRIKALILEGGVSLKGGATDATIREPKKPVKSGETYRITVPDAVEAVPLPQSIPLDIHFEDEHLIVLNKPAGMVVHPAAGNADGTLVNALLAHCGDSLSGIGGVKRPGIVHRLDKDTSGLMMAAKTDQAHRRLTEMFSVHDIERAYLAVVRGSLKVTAGSVDAPIGRHPTHRKKMAINEKGRRAVTHFRLKARYEGPKTTLASLIECRLETGRTHQVRVHMASLGNALIGDPVYGRVMNLPKGLKPALAAVITGFSRQALHAAVLGFTHPVTGDPFTFEVPPPYDMQELISLLEG